MKHTGILIYKDTLLKTFPLILIIGREPNDNDIDIENSVNLDDIWEYDFYKFPKCAFWNISHSLIAHSCGLKTSDLKKQFNDNNCSPIIYSDAFPISILSKNQQKEEIRRSVQKSKISSHIENIFSQTEIIKRVQVVILSGLERNEFEYSKSLIIQHCIKLKIEYLEVPFFYPLNKSKIILKSEKYLPVFKSIVRIYDKK